MLKPKTTVSTSTKPVVLPNGIKLHVQPQNLLLAANLAGISQGPVINQVVSLTYLTILRQNLRLSSFNH